MPKKLTEDQIQRAAWTWLAWAAATPATADGFLNDARALIREIEAEEGVGERVECSREDLMRDTIDCLRKERDKLRDGQESFIQEKMELRERITELRKERDVLKKELNDSYRRSEAYRELTEPDLQPLREYLGLHDYEAGNLAERVLQKIRALEKELEKSDESRSYYQKKNAGLETQVGGLLAERKEALFALGVVDAK